MIKVIAFGLGITFVTGLTFDILKWNEVVDVPYAGFIAAGCGIVSMLMFAAWLDTKRDQ